MDRGHILCGLTAVLVCVRPASALDPPHDESNSIDCQDCHAFHGEAGEYLLPRDEAQELMCRTCHNPTGPAAGLEDFSLHEVGDTTVDCGSCHDPHQPSPTTDDHDGSYADNLSLIRDDTTAYVSVALEPAVYQVTPDDLAFATEPWNGVCETCHTATAHYTNDAYGDHTHQAGADCLTCHGHGDGFAPTGGCTDCHYLPQGARRQIVENAADGQGDFARTSHHVQTAVDDSDCAACHYTGDHGGGTVKLIDPDLGPGTVYDYDDADPAGVEDFCVGCHDAGGAERLATPLHPFTDGETPPDIGASWGDSAHASFGYALNGNAPVSCMGDGSTTGCHGNGHGSDSIALLESPAGDEIDDLCFRCHTEGGVVNEAISGPTLADDIEEAFALNDVHDLGQSFTVGSETHTLQCTTCHNPHVATGGYWDAGLGLSPVTLPDIGGDNDRAMGSALFGVAAGETMHDYAAAASGVYNIPNGDYDEFNGNELPDYVTFCLACHHGVDGLGTVAFGSEMHGDANAGACNRDGGTCPNWFSCGKAAGWNLDDCDEAVSDCWPVLPSGRGRTVYTRPATSWTLDDPGYSPSMRNASVNFVMSCTDCHEAHGGPYRIMRDSVNGRGNNPTDWNGDDGICNACHYMWSDWHAGMSCGVASCHVSNSPHGMGSAGDPGPTLTFDQDLVFSMGFDNNLNDSGDFNLHGVWRVVDGSYTTGVSGSAAVFDDSPVEVGTENEWWSTDAGYHGTWKHTEMKYNMTLEAWVYPTDASETDRILAAKHTYWTGGYALVLEPVDGTMRVGLMTNMTNGAPDYANWDSADCNGLRGAYSTVQIPLDTWSHVAATFDHTLPDADPNDLSVGRVRIYVNGEDVTTSDADVADCFAQPGVGEEAMTPQSDLSPDNESVCYAGHWCASALSLGGVNWSAPNDNFIGRLDGMQLWNITQDSAYFETVDESKGPRIDTVLGEGGSADLVVTFSEDVYDVQAADFLYTDADDGRTVVAVAHVDGDWDAIVTLASPLDGLDDIGTDTLAFVAASVYDEYGTEGETLEVVVDGDNCPASSTTIEFDEAAGSLTVTDVTGVLVGDVGDPTEALLGDDYFTGDAVDNAVEFLSNDSCYMASTDVLLEVRFQPEVVDDGNDTIIQRLFAKDGDNYQISVWRNMGASWSPPFSPPSDVAVLAFWIKPIDPHGGQTRKLVMTDYDACPIQAGHWYRAQVLWDSDMPGGVFDQPFVPAVISVDDQGPTGDDVGEAWSGFADCTDADQSQLPTDRWLYTEDELDSEEANILIGTNAAYTRMLEGRIDYVIIGTD